MINIIKTRFNVNFKHLENDLSNRHLDEKWLDYRLDLFLKYCAPSVLGQNRGDFYWIINFDKDTKQSFINKISDLDKRIKPITLKKQEVELLKNITKEYDRFIFTRIDSDDCLRKNFINNIYNFSINNINKEEFLIDINFLVLQSKTNYFYKKEMPANVASHFVSLCTKNIEANIYMQHGIIANNYDYNRIEDYLAIRVVHESNLKNKFSKKQMIETNIDILNQFNIINL
jgi:hypothetical protein